MLSNKKWLLQLRCGSVWYLRDRCRDKPHLNGDRCGVSVAGSLGCNQNRNLTCRRDLELVFQPLFVNAETCSRSDEFGVSGIVGNV